MCTRAPTPPSALAPLTHSLNPSRSAPLLPSCLALSSRPPGNVATVDLRDAAAERSQTRTAVSSALVGKSESAGVRKTVHADSNIYNLYSISAFLKCRTALFERLASGCQCTARRKKPCASLRIDAPAPCHLTGIRAQSASGRSQRFAGARQRGPGRCTKHEGRVFDFEACLAERCPSTADVSQACRCAKEATSARFQGTTRTGPLVVPKRCCHTPSIAPCVCDRAAPSAQAGRPIEKDPRKKDPVFAQYRRRCYDFIAGLTQRIPTSAHFLKFALECACSEMQRPCAPHCRWTSRQRHETERMHGGQTKQHGRDQLQKNNEHGVVHHDRQ
jgi:hypothetical protein